MARRATWRKRSRNRSGLLAFHSPIFFTNDGASVESSQMRQFFLASLLVAGCAASAIANEAVISVSLDRATVIKAPANTAMVVIGNPGIADVSVQKNGVMVLTGKSFGETNMIALNDKGEMISESWLRVRPSQRTSSVTVFRAGEPETYSCAPDCQPTVSLGDSDKFFGRTGGQVGARNGFAQQAAPPR
jgi:Pilus formation protein N terminal region